MRKPLGSGYLFILLVLIANDILLNAVVKQKGTSQREWIFISKDKRSFRLHPSGKEFKPVGFNYDHDEKGRLIEDYWHNEWDKVVEDFKEMKKLGANVVRIHLQFGKFVEAPNKINPQAIEQLKRILKLAEDLGIYLYITGLGCYNPRDCPSWYNELDEKSRWDAQAFFWEEVSSACANSPAVFCYDLMNEPVVPGAPQKDWLPPPPFGDKYYTQFISIDPSGRPRYLVALKWIQHLTLAIRKHDRRHLITVGLVSWSLDRPGLTSGFVPEKIYEYLDFLSVHIYPESGKLDEYVAILKGFNVGKPVVVAEIFPLYCSVEELELFIRMSTELAQGWLSFYWGTTPGELGRTGSIVDGLIKNWLETFEKLFKI